jgi:acetyltransferase-like isoleucine patch superfamily enzyme
MKTRAPELNHLNQRLRELQEELQNRKIEQWQRRVSFGDLITERSDNAKQYGFGKGTTCYDNVLILGDVKIGRNCWIGPNVILDGRGGLVVGDHVTFSAGVQVYTHDTVEQTTSMGVVPIRLAPTRIGSGVYLGPNTVVQMGVTIGDRAVIGAMSFVNRDIPGDAKAWGIPAQIFTGKSPAAEKRRDPNVKG